MMSQQQAVHITNISDALVGATTVVRDINEAVSEVYGSIIEELREVGIEGTKEYVEVRKLLVMMDDLFHCSSIFSHSVKSIFARCTEEKLVEIQTYLYEGDTSPLVGFLLLLQDLIRCYKESHKDFAKIFKEIYESVLNVIRVLDNLRSTARDKKILTQVTGGSLSASLLGVSAIGGITTIVLVSGIVIAIVGGLFTVGIGTLPAIIGTAGALAITAGVVTVATGAAGAGTAAITIYAAEKYSRKAKKFKQIKEKLDVLHRQMGNLHEKLMDIKTGTDCIISEMNTVHFCLNIQDDYSNVMMVCEQLRFLLQNRNQCWDCIERECQGIELIHIDIRQSRRLL